MSTKCSEQASYSKTKPHVCICRQHDQKKEWATLDHNYSCSIFKKCKTHWICLDTSGHSYHEPTYLCDKDI